MVVFAGHLAWADSPANARDLFKQARQRYEAGAFSEAAELFQKSYDLSKAPGLLFNLGQAWRNHGDCTRALAAYRTYLAQTPKAPNAVEVNELIAAMVRCEKAEKPGEQPSTSTPPAPERPPPETGLISLPPPPPPPSPALTVVAVSLDVVAVAALAVGTGFSVSASSASARLTELYLGRLVWTTELSMVERQGQRDSLVGVVALSVGAALAVGGLVVTIIRLLAEPPATPGAIAWAASR